MAPLNGSPKDSPEGFEGAITGLGLSDVIQLHALNRFSGCIRVYYNQSTGLIFFRDGEVIHAEQGGRVGEEAFYEILQWPGGRFSLDPNVTTTGRSISRSWKFLLMEAHRLLDERRSGRAAPKPPPLPPGAPPSAAPRRVSPATVVERIRQVPGVAYALVLTKEGARVGDDSYQAEVLEGQTAFLTQLARRMSEIFRLGEVLAAVIQGGHRNLLMLTMKQHYLTILMLPDSDPGAVEAEIRRILTSAR